MLIDKKAFRKYVAKFVVGSGSGKPILEAFLVPILGPLCFSVDSAPYDKLP